MLTERRSICSLLRKPSSFPSPGSSQAAPGSSWPRPGVPWGTSDPSSSQGIQTPSSRELARAAGSSGKSGDFYLGVVSVDLSLFLGLCGRCSIINKELLGSSGLPAIWAHIFRELWQISSSSREEMRFAASRALPRLQGRSSSGECSNPLCLGNVSGEAGACACSQVFLQLNILQSSWEQLPSHLRAFYPNQIKIVFILSKWKFMTFQNRVSVRAQLLQCSLNSLFSGV